VAAEMVMSDIRLQVNLASALVEIDPQLPALVATEFVDAYIGCTGYEVSGPPRGDYCDVWVFLPVFHRGEGIFEGISGNVRGHHYYFRRSWGIGIISERSFEEGLELLPVAAGHQFTQ
jgi:hypothetical protein